jgi:DivIVA domain-containing protein
MPLTPEDVHNVAFSKPSVGKHGYNEDEVDAFLDLVETEMRRLLDVVDDLRRFNPDAPLMQPSRPSSPTPQAPTSVDSDGPESASGIFISYRRDDERSFAGRLYDRLLDRLGEQNVFMDVDSIELGLDFKDVIDDRLGRCCAMLVVIGKRWLDCVGPDGDRRLNNPDDFVRLEIETALARPGVRVIPVLVDGASVPNSSDLPEVLSPLARRNGISMSHEGFGGDLGRLLTTLQRVLSGSERVSSPTQSD